MRIELSGTDTASFGHLSVTHTKGPVCKLARKMVASGINECMEVSVYRDGVECFSSTPLRKWASMSVSEGDGQCAKFVPYVPFAGIG